MKPKFFVSGVLLLTVLLLAGCKSSAIKNRDDGPSAEAGAGDVDLSVDTQEKFQSELEEWNRILVMNTNKLKLRLKAAAQGTSEDIQDVLDELDEKRDEAQQTLSEFKTKTAENWQDFKAEAQKKFEAWEDAYEEIKQDNE